MRTSAFLLVCTFLVAGYRPAYCQVKVGEAGAGWFVQEYFPDGPYMDDAGHHGDGSMFVKFSANKPDLPSHYLSPDTVYIVPNDYPFVYSQKRYLECFDDTTQYFENSQELKNKSLIRNIRKASLAPWKIRNIEYRKVYLTYQVQKIGERSHTFLYLDHKRRGDGLIFIKRVLCIDIKCLSSKEKF